MQDLIKQIPGTKFLARTTYRFGRILPDFYARRKLTNAKDSYSQRIVDVLSKFENFNLQNESNLISEIEKERKNLLSSTAPLVDGTLGTGGLYDEGLTIKNACQVSKPVKALRFMYLLIREFNPVNVIELGTNVGISSAYQAAALKFNGCNGNIITLEASPYRLRLAKNLHKKLGLDNVAYKEGLFSKTLENVLSDGRKFDFAFIDGHHQYQPTLDYFNLIFEHSTDNAVFVFDDIRWSDGMKQAWSEIQTDKRVVLAVDLYSIGICVVTKQPSSSHHVFPLIYSILH